MNCNSLDFISQVSNVMLVQVIFTEQLIAYKLHLVILNYRSSISFN